MNISNSEQDLLTLISRIEHMERQQAILKKYVFGIKHELDNLIDKFEGRPEVQLMESLQWELADLQRFLHQQVYPTPKNAQIKKHDIYELSQNNNESCLELLEIVGHNPKSKKLSNTEFKIERMIFCSI
jgi:hypothetical protein